ncbi:hypothetical protein IWQ57_004025, partial [Coemansia nantahalensis]
MPPSDLISVRAFRDKYAGLVRNQRDCGLFSTQAGWSGEVRDEVARRCQIVDDLSFSNAAFVNPTLFHMLRQHREFNEATERELLQKKRESAAEQERRQREQEAELQAGEDALRSDIGEQNGHGAGAFEAPASADGPRQGYSQAASSAGVAAGGFGDASMLLSVEVGQDGAELDTQPMDVDASTVEDALARLA